MWRFTMKQSMKRWMAGGLAGACMLAGTIAVAAPAASAATTAAPAASTCPGGHYPAAIVGVPTKAKVGMTGMALWADSHGWHLRVSEAGPDRAVFTGAVTTNGVMRSVARHTEGGDLVLSVGDRAVAFRFVNYGHLDGIDFVVPCSSVVHFAIAMNGKALPVNEILVGSGNHSPSTNPFSIHKVA
jgi:hypothetical protein